MGQQQTRISALIKSLQEAQKQQTILASTVDSLSKQRQSQQQLKLLEEQQFLREESSDETLHNEKEVSILKYFIFQLFQLSES